MENRFSSRVYFADPNELVFCFRRAYQQTQEHFHTVYGFELFLELSEEDSRVAIESFLISKVGSKVAHELVGPFRMVQNLRSSGVARRKGKGYSIYIARYGLNKFSNQNKFITLLENATWSLEKLAII